MWFLNECNLNIFNSRLTVNVWLISSSLVTDVQHFHMFNIRYMLCYIEIRFFWVTNGDKSVFLLKMYVLCVFKWFYFSLSFSPSPTSKMIFFNCKTTTNLCLFNVKKHLNVEITTNNETKKEKTKLSKFEWTHFFSNENNLT